MDTVAIVLASSRVLVMSDLAMNNVVLIKYTNDQYYLRGKFRSETVFVVQWVLVTHVALPRS